MKLEPVAWIKDTSLKTLKQDGATVLLYPNDYLIRPAVPLYDASALAAVRDAALEDAAKVLEDMAKTLADDGSVVACERAMELRVMQREIRAMKGKA